ncbi:hypothetical protein PV327_005038 [Microctonus hyperodae]|uniref:Uncharacterized protein n=1 Tax=Microctonus hyperodae TaxID=165561 RepID=A0AA39KZ58_MICHY|nr:hypothetical protein PV327_005038 [Microctonus hyperodae]
MQKFHYTLSHSGHPSVLTSIHNGLKFKSKDFPYFGRILRKFNGNLKKLAITKSFKDSQSLVIPIWIFRLIIENGNLNYLKIDIHNKHIHTECLNFLRTDNLQHSKLSYHLKFELSISVVDAVKK